MSEQKLKAAFLEALPERLKKLEQIYGKWRGEGMSTDELELLHRLSHNLSGACAIYGFSAVADASQKLEQVLRELKRGQKKAGADACDQVGRMLSVVRKDVARACSQAATEVPGDTTT